MAPAAYLEGLTVSPHDAIEAEDWEQHHHNLLFDGVENLDDRSRDIIQSRWLLDPKSTLQDLADKYGRLGRAHPPTRSGRFEKNSKARFDA